jgi:hypothetical protein
MAFIGTGLSFAAEQSSWREALALVLRRLASEEPDEPLWRRVVEELVHPHAARRRDAAA